MYVYVDGICVLFYFYIIMRRVGHDWNISNDMEHSNEKEIFSILSKYICFNLAKRVLVFRISERIFFHSIRTLEW